MITPAYAPTATERVLPRLALDFTTAIADSRVDTARAANTATRFNASGLIEIVNANLPRFDFSPTALTCRGQLIEEARTNLFLNSLIDGTNLATQSVTLSAVTYTLSFYGSGSVAISGGHSATVNGIGDFPNRKTYTFTPTAGSSTFTISGDVKFAQLEAGAFPTSYIPTTTTSLTRNADVVSMTGTNFSDWYNASEGAFYAETSGAPATGSIYSVDGGTTGTRMLAQYNSSTATLFRIVDSTDQVSLTQNAVVTAGGICKIVSAYKQDSFATSTNAAAVSTDAAGTVPTVNNLKLGRNVLNSAYMTAHFRKFMYWPQRLTNDEVRAFSK